MNNLVHKTIHDKPVDAATVILIRDYNNSLQTLLLCRGNSRTVMNSAWVFPGGKVDSTDFDSAHNTDQQLADSANVLLNEPELDNKLAGALFIAACRETREETGVSLEASHLQTWSRWITPNEPSMMKKRFDADDQATLASGESDPRLANTPATDKRTQCSTCPFLLDKDTGSISIKPGGGLDKEHLAT